MIKNSMQLCRNLTDPHIPHPALVSPMGMTKSDAATFSRQGSGVLRVEKKVAFPETGHWRNGRKRGAGVAGSLNTMSNGWGKM